MATTLALKRSATSANKVFSKLFAPVRSVCVANTKLRGFNTNTSQVEAYDDYNRAVQEDRRNENNSYVARRRDNDFFSDLFDPFSTTRSLSQIMNMMDQFAENPFLPASRLGGSGFGYGARRGWDAKEDDEALNLRFDMPGLDKDNVKISVEQNTLVIKGEAEKESGEDEQSVQRRRYSSRIDLPMGVYKLNEIQAEMKNGVLKLVVPKVKSEERKDVWEVEVK
ncbi:Alpha crystallin/Hsp20 domain-containing protein [Artemisia annua]|uniref:Alpha crystallin/Hsp20 domain-containing protein n=1 Tax=Artemisia annua TaxID=35608 RepID=A0A2U1NUG6_ARTAN|nr:Alpha crystallin/Hsp20 domain-containing protein [Artemisia annua]